MIRDWDEATDVIIIGSGFAGLAAAIEARLAGARVLVFEKMAIPGGNSRISDGALCAPNNFLQRQYGVEDSPAQFYEDLKQAGRGHNQPQVLQYFSQRAADAIDWTRDYLGVAYLDRLDRFGGHSVARGLTMACHSGLDCIRAMCRILKDLGGELRCNYALESFVTEPDGAVSGAIIRQGGTHKNPGPGTLSRVHSTRAVVLATGGFGNDVAFRSQQDPTLGDALQSTNHKGATAEGLKAAMHIGAAPVLLDVIQLGPWGCPDEKGYGIGARFAAYSIFPAGILVDPATGSRFVNEWADRKIRGDAMLALGHPAIGIVDADGAALDTDSLQHGLRSGKVHSYGSLTGIATAHGMPEMALLETVQAYHDAIARGEADAFGKQMHATAPTLTTPPYYAMRLWPKVHHTPGGIAIDAHTRVRTLHGEVIPRLFAAGEVCGGVHGVSRLGGCALTECIVFGRLAGQQAAACSNGDS